MLLAMGVSFRRVLLGIAGAYLPVFLSYLGKKAGAPGGRSLAYVLGNMLSAGGEL